MNNIDDMRRAGQKHESWHGSNGKLDGLTILRYCHIFKCPDAGGVEQYLSNLNRMLLERNKMTIIQMHLVKDSKEDGIEIESIGQGKLIWIPVLLREYKRKDVLSRSGMKLLLNNLTNTRFINNYIKAHRYRYSVLNSRIMDAIGKCVVDLVIFHWISYDSKEVIKKLAQTNTPFLVINHFDNQRFNLRSVRNQIVLAAGFGGVSSVNVPEFLNNRLVNLSDGIDTEFFRPECAKQVQFATETPVVFLPARIAPGKGHLDAIRALALLRAEGIKTKIVFAGRIDSLAVLKELHSNIDEMKMKDDVSFIGRVNQSDLRDWYARSAVVVLPSYSEGLPRVLLEAQAMKKPVIVYDVGGVSQAVRHDETGYALRRGDYSGIAKKVKELLTDEKKRNAMGIAGRRFVIDQFSLSSLAERHEEFYLNGLSGRRIKEFRGEAKVQ